MEIEGQVGPVVYTDGTNPTFRLGRGGEQVITELHGKYWEQAFRGNLFVATMTAGVIMNPTGAALANWALYNPASSGKHLVPVRIDVVLTAAPGTPVIGAYVLVAQANPIAAAVTGTAVSVNPAIIGSAAAAVGKPLSTTTFPANPIIIRPFVTKLTGAITTIPDLPSFGIDFDGTLGVAPGCAIGLQQLAADTTNASSLVSVVWEEVPV